MAEESNHGNSGAAAVEEEMDAGQLYIYLCNNICPVLAQEKVQK